MSRSELAALPAAAGGASAVVRLVADRIEIAGAVVLRAVELELVGGELVGVAGHNGAGKSTLLRALAGLITAPTVACEMDARWTGQARTAVALVGHEPSLHPGLTLEHNLELAFGLAGIGRRYVRDALARVGLAGAATRPAGACSYGMRRRADLARVWALQPALLLLDEPTAGLDAASASLPAELARSTLARGGTVVVASHAGELGVDDADARWIRIESGKVRPWR